MTQEWPRRANGKLVQFPGGPIQGPDFQTTGRSAQPPFPDLGDVAGFPGAWHHQPGEVVGLPEGLDRRRPLSAAVRWHPTATSI